MRKTIFLLALTGMIGSVHAQREITDPKATEQWGPVPAVVTPGKGNQPPSDAVILLGNNGDLSLWESVKDGEVPWDLEDGVLTVKPGSGAIRSRLYFGDCQVHIEWRTPATVEGTGQGRGNSGVFFMERYEVQVLDNYNNRTYANGQAGSVYKQHIPLVNACRPPGEWQEYDIIWTAPRFNEDGSLKKPAFITVFHNGILIQNHAEIRGTTAFIGEHQYNAHPERLPLMLQDHNNPVSYRNIWIRDL